MDDGDVVSPSEEKVEQADRDFEEEPKYSIRNDIVDVNGKEYDTVVALDKHVRKTILSSPKELMEYIKRNFIGLQISVLDGKGNTEIIEFARDNETVEKNKKRHPVLGELGYIKGDTRKLVVVNLKEVLEKSDYDPIYSSSDNEHGWLDERGWKSRKTYVLTDNIIYEAFLKIAKARDGRNILYSVNLDVKKGIAVDQGATSKRAAVLAAMPSRNMVTRPDPEVKKNSDRDTTYLDAVKRGDMKAAQRMVDEAAKEAGYTIKAYHGTPIKGLTVFDNTKIKSADTITYDDSGNVIPLSQRFNPESKDIRHSLSKAGAQYAPSGGFSIPEEAVKLRREAETNDAAHDDLDTVSPEGTPVAEDTAQSAPDQPTQPQQPEAQASREQQTAARPDRNVQPQEALKKQIDPQVTI